MIISRIDQVAWQPDLFGERISTGRSREYYMHTANIAELDDLEILARIPAAKLSEVEALCELVMDRGIGDDAVPALEALWRRFFGFGVDGPLREQRCALNALAKIGTEMSRQALVKIVDAPDLFDAILPLALECATKAHLALPAQSVTRWLEDTRSEVRELSFMLASNCGSPVPKNVLEAGLLDSEASVRRACLLTMGHFGHGAAKSGLLAELERNPSSEIVTALAGILDDDIITRLGRCAMKHEHLREQIVEELESSAEPRALKFVNRLKGLQ